MECSGTACCGAAVGSNSPSVCSPLPAVWHWPFPTAPPPPTALLQATDKPAPEITPEKLLLPGEELQPAAGHARHAVGIGRSRATAAAAAAAAGAPASSCVWLTGVLATAVEQHLLDAFSQFGFPQKVGG